MVAGHAREISAWNLVAYTSESEAIETFRPKCILSKWNLRRHQWYVLRRGMLAREMVLEMEISR